MSTYKVIQNVEAEDKLVGPLTLRQFVYAGVSAVSLYLSFLAVTKHGQFILVVTLPIAAFTGFFAFPWGKDQPTEVWALAKLRFALKPRKRTWDQSGIKELVTITVPKVVERHYTNGLSQDEVQSRLGALANTIDSRGWAVKNMNVNLNAGTQPTQDYSDRLVTASSLPQEVTSVDVRASDDILDENANPIAQHFSSMIDASTAAHHQQILAQMQQAAPPVSAVPQPAPSQNYWFMQPPAAAQISISAPQAANPTPEELAMVDKFKAENSSQTPAYGHLKTIKTPEELAAEAARQPASPPVPQPAPQPAAPAVTPINQAAIINLANNDDLDVATIARQAHQQMQSNDGEVVISLH